jgi:hypothetical protein
MRFDIELERQMGDEFYFTLTREDGVKGVIQLNMGLLMEESEDCIEWEDE